MKNFAAFLLMVTFTTVVNAQTWLEKSMNGLSYGTTDPDREPLPNLYSEPIDTAWRLGNTGIGTYTWPKVKFHVHGGADLDTEIEELVNMHGGYPAHHSIFSNGGNDTVPFINSILAIGKRDNLDSGIVTILGVSAGDNTKYSVGVNGVSVGENTIYALGVKATAVGYNNRLNAGVHTQGEGENTEVGNFGVWAECLSEDPNGVNIGVFGCGNDMSEVEGVKNLVNIGVKGWAYCLNNLGGTKFNAGIFGQNIGCTDSTNGGSDYPIGSYAGYFDGNVLITGWMSSLSDRRLKENVKSIEKALDKLMKVNVYSYNYKQGIGLSLSNSLSYGVIADELEKEFPELVKNVNVINHNDPNNSRNIETYKSVNYQEMIPILLQAVKELNDKIDALDPEKSSASLKSLKGEIDQLNGNLKQVAVQSNLQSKSTLKAFPNPSQSDVTIEIDQVSCNDCWLLITDLSGKIILQQPVHQSYEKITLSKGKLGSGIYQCNLVENGNVTNSVKIALLQ